MSLLLSQLSAAPPAEPPLRNNVIRLVLSRIDGSVVELDSVAKRPSLVFSVEYLAPNRRWILENEQEQEVTQRRTSIVLFEVVEDFLTFRRPFYTEQEDDSVNASLQKQRYPHDSVVAPVNDFILRGPLALQYKDFLSSFSEETYTLVNNTRVAVFAFPFQYEVLRWYNGTISEFLCVVDAVNASTGFQLKWYIEFAGTKAVYLVETNDPFATMYRIETPVGFKAVRVKT